MTTDSIKEIMAQDIRLLDPDHTLDAEELAFGLVSYGWIKARSQKDEPHPLSFYKDGQAVEVVKDGEWKPGVINGVEKRLGLLYVHTERGPVSIASPKFIRPHPAPEVFAPPAVDRFGKTLTEQDAIES